MKKLLSVLMVMTILFTVVSGCGKKAQKGNSSGTRIESTEGTQSNEKSKSTTTADNNKKSAEKSDKDGSVFTEEFLPLNNYEDLLNTFKEFGYDYNTKPEGSEATKWSFLYESLGKETIDGTETDHIKVTIVENGEVKVSEGWYNDKWESVKYKDAEYEKTGIDASFYGSSLTMYSQMYINLLALAGTVISKDGTVDDFMYNMNEKRSTGESIDLGSGTVKIELYDIEDKLLKNDRLFGLTKIDGKWMYVILEIINKTKDTLDGIRITRAVPR